MPGHGGLRLSASIGGVLSNGSVIEDAIGRADQLMYQAKNRKNMVVTEDNLVADGIKKGMLHDREKIRQLILIVDDSELNRALLSEMLKDDFRILEASNGRECLDALEQYGMGISLVLLDINMPVMDGFEVVDMDESEYLMFQGEAFEEEYYEEAIKEVERAMEKYDPSLIGARWNGDEPRIQLEPRGERGYIEYKAIKKA